MQPRSCKQSFSTTEAIKDGFAGGSKKIVWIEVIPADGSASLSSGKLQKMVGFWHRPAAVSLPSHSPFLLILQACRLLRTLGENSMCIYAAHAKGTDATCSTPTAVMLRADLLQSSEFKSLSDFSQPQMLANYDFHQLQALPHLSNMCHMSWTIMAAFSYSHPKLKWFTTILWGSLIGMYS